MLQWFLSHYRTLLHMHTKTCMCGALCDPPPPPPSGGDKHNDGWGVAFLDGSKDISKGLSHARYVYDLVIMIHEMNCTHCLQRTGNTELTAAPQAVQLKRRESSYIW